MTKVESTFVSASMLPTKHIEKFIIYNAYFESVIKQE